MDKGHGDHRSTVLGSGERGAAAMIIPTRRAPPSTGQLADPDGLEISLTLRRLETRLASLGTRIIIPLVAS